MNEQFQHLRELFHEVPPRPSTHQNIETTILKILSTNQIPIFINLLKTLQQNRVDLINSHHVCFQDFWYKIKSWMGPRKPKTLQDQCFKILVNLLMLHSVVPNEPVTAYESLFEDIFSTVNLIKDPNMADMKLKFFMKMYEKKKIFDIVGLVNAMLEIIVQHINTLRHYSHQKGSSSSSSSKKNKRDNGNQLIQASMNVALEFLKILFKNTKMSSEEHFTAIVKSYAEYIVQHKTEELFPSLFVFVQKPELRIPHRGYIHLCTMLCQSVNFNESFCSKSTEIMKFLIRKNPYIFSILIDLLNYSPFVTFYRGAVFFIGVFSWGRFAMKELAEFRIMTLKAMYKVLSVNDQPLNFEIILSLKRLIFNFGATMILEWDIIFKILKKMKKLFVMGKSMEDAQATNRAFVQMNMRLKKEVRSCVQVVFDLYRTKKFLGGENKLLKLMLYYRPEFSDDTQFSQFLIEHIPCSPNQTEQWEDNLKLLMLEFFRKEDNVLVKLQVLEIVKNLLLKYAALYATEILKVVMPFLKEEKRDYTLYFLIWMADKLPLSSKKFILICSTLNHMLINETIYESHPSVHLNSPIAPPAAKNFFSTPQGKRKNNRPGSGKSKRKARDPSSVGSNHSSKSDGGSGSGSSDGPSRPNRPSSTSIPSGPSSTPNKGGRKGGRGSMQKQQQHYLSMISKRGREIREGTKLKLMNGMVQIFLNNFARSPVIKSKIMFNFILKFMPHLTDPLLREMLNVFLRFRATSIAQLKIGDKISPYLYVHHSSSSAPGMAAQTDIRNMQSAGFVPNRRLSCEVDLSKLMEILWNLVLVKDDVEILYLILKILLNYLRNFYILKDFSVEKLIYIVTSFVQKKLLGTSLDSHLPGLGPASSYGGAQSSHYKLEGSISSKRASPKTLRLVLPLLDVLRMLIGFVANKHTISRAAKTEFVKLILSLSTPEVQTRLSFDQRIEFQERYLNVLYFLVSELPDDLVPQFLLLQKYLSSLKPIYSVVILKLRLLHCLHLLFPQLIAHQRFFYPKRRFQKSDIPVVEGVLDMITPYVSKNKYSYFIRSLAYTSLMSWFVRCNFDSRKRILRKCFPILYIEMARENSRLAESFLDFLIKYTYINCDQKFEMNRTLNDQFRNQDYRAWSLGNGILTAQVGKFGYVLLRHRRPTGNIGWTMKLVNTVHVYNMMDNASGGSNKFQYTDPFFTSDSLSQEEEKSLRLDLSYLLHKRKQDIMIPSGVGGISSVASSLTSHNSSIMGNAKSGSYGALSTRSLSLPSEEDLSFSEELYDTFSHHHHHQIHHHHQRRRRSIEKTIHQPVKQILPPQQQKLKNELQHQQNNTTNNNNNNKSSSLKKRKKVTPKKNSFHHHSISGEEVDASAEDNNILEEIEETEGNLVEDEDHQHEHPDDPDDDLILEEQYKKQKRSSDDDEDDEDDFFLPMEENIKENVFAVQSTLLEQQQSDMTPMKKNSNSSSSSGNGNGKPESVNVITPSSTFVNDEKKTQKQTSTTTTTTTSTSRNKNKKEDTLSYLLREAATSSPVLTNRQKNLQQQQKIIQQQQEEDDKNKRGRRRRNKYPNQQEEEEEGESMDIEDEDLDKQQQQQQQQQLKKEKMNIKRRRMNQRQHHHHQQKQQQFQNRRRRRRDDEETMTSSSSSMDTLVSSSTATSHHQHLPYSHRHDNNGDTKTQLSVLHPNFPYLFLRHWTFLSQEPPQGLKVCPELTMALNAFDFTPCHEIFRVGVLFVDKGQAQKNEGEARVFLNSFGTPRYLSFLKGLGDVVFLSKVDEMYAGGLDVSQKRRDGKYTIIFKDQISSMVFHVATMMPNREPKKKIKIKNNQPISMDSHEIEELMEQEEEEDEEQEQKKDMTAYYRKKSLIGNDLVVIIYNENEHYTINHNTDICKSEVKTIEIIIYPLEEGYNMIKLKIRKEKLRGILSFFPLEQIVSDLQLPRIVRNYTRLSCMAINAFNKKQKDYESVWSERINMTKRIKARFSRKAKKRSSNQSQADMNLQKEINDFFLD